uniref:Uncharacterized protein n=1 Tax=Rhizophora mucronata TaxID=61149 RepID=A0A2P2P6X5_RHIMU
MKKQFKGKLIPIHMKPNN